MERLESLRQRRIQRDGAMAKAENASGLERARYLDEALSALKNEEVLITYHRGLIDEILALDPNNEAGLGDRYRNLFKVRKCNSEIGRLCVGKDGAAMFSNLKAYTERSDVPVESRQ